MGSEAPGNLVEEGKTHQGPKAADRRRERSRALLGELLPGRRGPCRKPRERLWIQDTEERVAGLVPQRSAPEHAQGGTRLLREEGSGYSSAVRKARLTIGDQWTGTGEGEKGEREGTVGGGAERKFFILSLI